MAERTQLDDQIDEAIAELIEGDVEGFALVTSTGEEFTDTWYGPHTAVPTNSPRHPYTMLVASLVDAFVRIAHRDDGEWDYEDAMIEFMTSVMQAAHGNLDPDKYGIEHYQSVESLPSGDGS